MSESLFLSLLRRVENPPKPTDGPDFHAEYAFWRDGIRRDLGLLCEIAEGLTPMKAAYRAGDTSVGLALEWMEDRDWQRVITALLALGEPRA